MNLDNERRIDRCNKHDQWSPRAFSTVSVKVLEWPDSENDLALDHPAMIDISAVATSVIVWTLLRSRTPLKELLTCVHAVGIITPPQLWDGPIKQTFESFILKPPGRSEDDSLVLEQADFL